MSAEPAAPAYRRSVWGGSLARRADPFLDPVIAVVAVALALTALLGTDVDSVDPRLHDPDALSAVATVVAAGSLAWRRTRPVLSYAVFVAGAVVVSASFHNIGLLSLMMLLSLFSLATHGTRKEGVAGLGVGIACFVGLGLAGVPDLRTKDVLLALALLVASWAVAEALRSRREQQRSQVQAAVTEERLRIARELHDVVAHSMSLIAVQAGVGAHVIRTDPAAAEQSLDVIAETSRRALEQTRSMLGMLREETEDGTRPPTHGLDDLPALVADVRAAGLEVELARSGTAAALDAAVSLAAYRIVQESLTNVIKHSGAGTARVTVALTDRAVELEVTDPGPARATGRAGSAGHGLVGLDERARLVGGSLEHGTRGDGFRVHATLPVGAGR
jgi:signal transduction histidine kinase